MVKLPASIEEGTESIAVQAMNSGVVQASAATLLAERGRGTTSACTSGRSASCLLLVKEESFVSARQAPRLNRGGDRIHRRFDLSLSNGSGDEFWGDPGVGGNSACGA